MLKTFFKLSTAKGHSGKPPNDAYTDMLPLAESLIRSDRRFDRQSANGDKRRKLGGSP